VRRFPVALLFFFFLIIVSPAHAQSVHWEFAGWEGGGCYPNVEFDPSVKNRVYLTSDVAGIWRSDDLGEHWHFITKGLGNLIVPLAVVAPSDSNVIYAGTSAGVFYSRNAGESWAAADKAGGRLSFIRPESHRSIVVSSKDPGRLIAGSSSGEVFYSEDFGKQWKILGGRRPFKSAGPITALAWAEEENLLYTSSAEGLAVFSFAGSKWLFFEQSPKDITDFWMSPERPRVIRTAGQKKISTSRDGGNTWTAGAEVPKGKLYRVLVPGADDETVLAAWNDGWKGGVVRSEDGGEHWKPWDKEMTADTVSNPTRAWAGVHGRMNALKQDPFNKNVLFRTDWWGVWRSDDGGVTWTEKIKGSPNTVTSDIALSEDGDIYVATMDNGLLRSSDGGKSYQPLFPAKGYADDVNGHVWRVLVSGERILATSTPWNVDRNQVISSRDEGKTFERHSRGLPSKKPRKSTVWEHGYARAFAFHPERPDTVYLGIDGEDGGGFFISTNGTKNWHRGISQPGSLSIYNALAVDPGDPEKILWGSADSKEGGIYFSEDSGKSWRRASMRRVRIFDAVFGAERTAYAAGQDWQGRPVVYVSRDGGKNWNLLKMFDGHGSAEALCPLPDGRLAVGVVHWNGRAPGSVYLASFDSADGFLWKDIGGDLPDGEGPSALAYDPKKRTLYLARTAGSVYKTQL